MVKNLTDIRIDWCDYNAAIFACKNYHYSKTMPAGKNIRFGVWEDEEFIGAVIFGVGVQNHLVTPYGLKPQEGCELTRVALSKHKTPVTKILAVTFKLIKKHFPKIKLIVSFADANQGHLGKIYQAGNWIYTGNSHSTPLFYLKGKWRHQRSVGSLGYSTKDWKGQKKEQLDKFRYLMPLDKEIETRVKKLQIDYPKQIASVV